MKELLKGILVSMLGSIGLFIMLVSVLATIWCICAIYFIGPLQVFYKVIIFNVVAHILIIWNVCK